jgi:peroxiredoxin (alkyl hydroperoxide reductase subunit C)
MVKIGDEIPDFEMDAFHEGQLKKVKLSDNRGKWQVLMFYPADFTFICPTELAEMGQNYEEFKKAGAEVMSISTDTAFVHLAWHDVSPAIKQVNFPMLADPTGEVSKAFGTYIADEGLSLRATMIIDPDGVLKSMEIHDNSIGRSAKEILRKLQAAVHVKDNPGEVCPASWEPGKETLKPGVDLVGKI